MICYFMERYRERQGGGILLRPRKSSTLLEEISYLTQSLLTHFLQTLLQRSVFTSQYI
jgi:hypothetical protein